MEGNGNYIKGRYMEVISPFKKVFFKRNIVVFCVSELSALQFLEKAALFEVEELRKATKLGTALPPFVRSIGAKFLPSAKVRNVLLLHFPRASRFCPYVELFPPGRCYVGLIQSFNCSIFCPWSCAPPARTEIGKGTDEPQGGGGQTNGRGKITEGASSFVYLRLCAFSAGSHRKTLCFVLTPKGGERSRQSKHIV